MIIGFTGTQSGMTKFQKDELVKHFLRVEITEFIFRDFIGADNQAAHLAIANGINTFSIYPPIDSKHRGFFADESKVTIFNPIPSSYEERLVLGKLINVRWYPVEHYKPGFQHLVDTSDLMFAAPKEFKYSVKSGVWTTINYAWKTKKKDIIIIPPVERPEDDEDSSSADALV